MTKLNYTNRKSEGVKLGQIVAKDVRKRKPSSPSAHKDASPLELLLDNRVLTDDGLSEAARGLEDAVGQARRLKSPTLSILNLAGNALTCRSLYQLAETIRLARDDLQELDLSDNMISVASDEDAFHFATFLGSLGCCRALRSLNLSGNNLSGSRAWEVFARAYSNQVQQNSSPLETLADDTDAMNTDETSILGSLDAMTMYDVDGHDREACASAIRGLPSISNIQVNHSQLTDAGALWLSFCVGKHAWIQEGLRAKRRKPSSALCRSGFNVASNDQLSPIGQKILIQAEAASSNSLAVLPRIQENSSMSRNGSVDVAASRRVSSASYQTPHAVTPVYRRTSSSPKTPENEQGVATSELESSRRKIQRTILDQNGPQIVESWRAALKMLTYIRRLLPRPESRNSTPALTDRPTPVSTDKENEQPRTPSPISPSPAPHPQKTYASKLVVDNAEISGPAVSSGSTTPRIFKHPRARHENVSFHSGSSSPQSKVNGNARAAIMKAAIHLTNADEEIVGGLPIRAWVLTLRQICDLNGVLTQRQVDDIVRWSRDSSTLALERENIGKPQSWQVWKALEGMGCLSYEE